MILFEATHVSKPVSVSAQVFEKVNMIMENHGTRRAYHCTMADGSLEYLTAGEAGKIAPAAGRYLVTWADGALKVLDEATFNRRYTPIPATAQPEKLKSKPKGETK